jgi:hypothetical protein
MDIKLHMLSIFKFSFFYYSNYFRWLYYSGGYIMHNVCRSNNCNCTTHKPLPSYKSSSSCLSSRFVLLSGCQTIHTSDYSITSSNHRYACPPHLLHSTLFNAWILSVFQHAKRYLFSKYLSELY